jgi:CTP:molybdopterin cytidylyltransferase MocA
MGFPKALLDFRGAPFVVRILEACLALELRPRIVVLGLDASRIRPVLSAHDCAIVENPNVEAGPIASLRSALAALRVARPTAAVVWPVDFPHVRITTVERLMDMHERTHAPAVVPVFAGRRGHPVVWSESTFDEIESSDAATRWGARAILRAHQDAVQQVSVDDPAVVDEVNTPKDYERLVRRINRDLF